MARAMFAKQMYKKDGITACVIKENSNFEPRNENIYLNMKYTTLILCMLAATMAMPAAAQKKKNTARPENTVTAEQLIQKYEFDEAAAMLQRDIQAAQKSGKPTEMLETDLHRANMGADMLRGTERVIFVDSFKVARKNALATIKLSAEAGQWIPTSSVSGQLPTRYAEIGQATYINELKDRMFYAAADTVRHPKRIYTAYRQGNAWSTPQRLEGTAEEWTDQDNPFVMPDGVTLYFAAQGEESLGGYDLFVTRYNTETKQFLKAENLGMPFNSTANDYMLAIDETLNLGWLVTDRFQKPDTVCVYVFVPSESREVYELNDNTFDKVLRVARLSSISATQYDRKAVKAAKQRLQNAFERSSGSNVGGSFYVINDNTVYTSLAQFRSDAARRIAEQSDVVKRQIDELLEKRDALQLDVAQGKRSKEVMNQLRQINEMLPQLRKQYDTLCKNMRKAEK